MKVYNKNTNNFPRGLTYAGRGSKYGNKYIIGIHGTRDEVCDKHEAKIEADPVRKAQIIKELKGKDLLCFCKPARCHGDYLLRICEEDDKRIAEELKTL